MKSEFQDDPLQQAIDASLKRRFAPPSELAFELPTPRRREAPRLIQWRTWLPLAALAAAVLLVVYLQRPIPESEPNTSFVATASGVLEQVPLRDNGTSQKFRLAEEQPAAKAPDLERLYAILAEEGGEAEPCASPQERLESGAERANMLLARYGDRCLEPSDAVDLQGPFASPEWPSGTVLKGFVEGRAIVVVVEHEARIACCLQLDLPKESELSLFTWRCGSMRLTEITPLHEPRLLHLFGS